MRRPFLMLTFVTVGAVGLLAHPGPVHAECPFFVVPPATEAAQSARDVIVGTVVENIDGSYFDFRIRIDHVLRGPAQVGDLRRMHGVFPGWPLIETNEGKMVGPCEPIPGWKGNVIAFSLDALAPDGVTRYSAASWISGRLPFNREVPRTTLTDMRAALAGMPATDTDPATPRVTPTGTTYPLAVILAAALVAVAAFVATVRRSGGSKQPVEGWQRAESGRGAR